MYRMTTNRKGRRKAPLAAAVLALPLLSASLLLPTASRAQESPTASKTASKSVLTGVSLPAGVQRITQKSVVDAGVSQLKRVATNGGLNLGKTEHYGWKGEDHDTARSEALIKKSVTALEAGGWSYKKVTEKKVEGGGTLVYFLALNQKKNQAVLGCWTIGESFLILNWGEISKAETPGTGDEPTTGTGGSPSGNGATL
jgi:hypothetical protein